MKFMIRSYHQLTFYHSFEERYNYLRLKGVVGESTFGFDRYANQVLYHSKEWRQFRDEMIIRDGGCDLGIGGREIFKGLILHHINPITMEDIENRADCLFDPNNVICTSDNTHKAIHYGDESKLIKLAIARTRGDTKLW